ncbi:MAG: hypothetical protein R2711_13375 [Acidimicrobiales bacterium]
MPLFVAVGAAEDEAGVRIYHEDRFMGSITSASYRFGRLPAEQDEGEEATAIHPGV